jgi:hypothetical protein
MLPQTLEGPMKNLLLAAALILFVMVIVGQRYLSFRQRRGLARMETAEPGAVYLFTAPACAACARMKRTHAERIDDGSITPVDIAEQPQLARQFGILSVPATVVIRENRAAKVFLGFVSSAELQPWLARDTGAIS